MRYQALLALYQIYNKVLNLNSEDQIEQVRELRRTVENILIHYLDSLLDPQVLLGNGYVSNMILHEAANLVYRFFEYLKDRMQPYHLGKSMQMLLHCLLNPMTPLILKSTIIFCLYKFNLQLKSCN